jgi:hypothetical protein
MNKMKQSTVRKTIMLICLFGIVVCLLLFIPQIRQIIIRLAGQLFRGREVANQRPWNNFLIDTAIFACVFLTVLLFLNWKYKIDYSKYFINYSKYFFTMTYGSLYSGETEISCIETDKTITSTLMNKLKSNGWLVFSICIVFIIILVFFTSAHPIVPYDGDDWYTLSTFRHPVPLASGSDWNPSRVFPEVLGPLAGLFAAHIVNPVLGDYLASISFTVALIMAGFTTIFYWSLYRLFLTLSGSKMISILSGLIILCLYFGFFKTQGSGSHYMLHALSLCAYFAYTIPNLLNSICVCLLMRYAIRGTHISGKGLGGKTFIIFVIALYFAIFSMLFSVIILAVYCFWKLLIAAIHKEKLTKNLILIIILVGFFIYAIIEFTGGRATNIRGTDYYYPFFSLGYLRNCKVAFMNLLSLIGRIHRGLLFLTVSINIFAMLLLGFNMADDKSKPLVKTGMISLLSFGSLLPAMVILTGEIGSHTANEIMYMYGIFFYYILFSVLSLVYILTKFRKQAILSFLLAVIFLEATNMSKPYRNQNSYSYLYFGHGITTQQKIDIVNEWIEQVKFADENRAESVIISVPESSNPDGWPYGDNLVIFSSALYAHGITSRRIKIIVQPDRAMTDKL